ncbi:hypothetical protein [Calothrix sp. CCY 0018]|uniref:hypothetical protein n=1 Tax=Calothrix sp. CCY 0018 TaxID=3103864 RepID=UPI0039C66331
MQIKQLIIATGGLLSLALGTGSITPAQAALLDFSFENENGLTGSFTLDTEAEASEVPADFGFGTGILYSNTVSDFDLSVPERGLNFNGETADYQILTNPTPPPPDSPVTPPPGGALFPPGTTLSGVVYPSECSEGVFTCNFSIPIFYTGDVAELPELSDNVDSYSTERIEFFDFNPETQTLEVNREIFTSSNITFKTVSVAEGNSSLSLFALGIVGGGLLFKRRLNRAV